MSKQTSQMYGIKVKETINYAEMGDIALYYEDSLWTVKSNFENVWRDGVHYDKGDTIVTFQDGEVATFTMMGQHTDVTPYINKLYSVYSNASENPQAGDISVEYRVTNSDRSHGGYSEVYEIVIFKLVNGLIQDRKYISSEDVRKYKTSCDKPVPAWNLTVDWNYTNPQSGYPMKSWVIRSNSNYIKYEEQYYKVGEDLDVFEYNDPILMAIVDETQQHETKKKVGEPPLVVVTERVDGGRPASWSWNRENIVHDVLHTHKDVYYNGHRHKAMYLLYSKTSVAGAYKIVKGLAFAWADPYWFLVTNAEGMEYNGQILKKGQLIKAWSPGDSLNLYVKKDTAVRKPKTDIPYDNIAYELLATGDTNVTVIRLVNDEEPPDSRVVVATSDSPKVCWGIELRVEGPNWTIYSKNNFIKYNGRTYKKNKSILSFGLDEELHIEIKDEENKYYIKSSITYHVTNEAADSVNYKVRTSKMDHNIIIEKSVNGNEEPWVRVNTYDAIIMPYDYEDLSLEFNTVNRSWVLRALSDNVYSDGVKYDTNETIAEWHYTEIKELNHIEALKDSEENIKVAATTTGGGTEFGQDFDEFVPDDYQDFEVLHSSTKALWKVLSNSDDTWISGINYRKGDVILEVADKTFVDPFTVSVRYYNESQHVYSYRTYSISLTYSALTNKTNLIIDPTNGNPIVFNDKTVNEGDVYSITKQNAKSMYGYIWKRDMPGPTPPGSDRYDFYIIVRSGSGYWHTEKLVGIKATGIKRSAVVYTTRGSNAYLRLLGKVGFRLFIQDSGFDHIIYSDNYGDTWTRAESLPNEQIVRIVNAMQLITDYSIGQTFVTAPFKVFSIVGDTIRKTKETIEHKWWDSDVYYADPPSNRNIFISCSDDSNGYAYIKKFDISNGTVDGPSEDIEAYNAALKAEWNWAKTDPEVIEIQSTAGFTCSRTISIGDKILMLAHMSCLYRKGSPIGAFPPIERVVWDWGICAYEYGSSGLGILHKNVVSDSDYAKLENWVTHMDVKFGEYYYGYNWLTSDSDCYIFEYNSGNINLVRSIPKGSLLFSIKVYNNSSFSDYDNYDVYCGINSTSIDWINRKIYIRPDSFSNKNSLYNNREYIMDTQSGSNGSSSIHIFLDNPLFNSGPNNFAVIDSMF